MSLLVTSLRAALQVKDMAAAGIEAPLAAKAQAQLIRLPDASLAKITGADRADAAVAEHKRA